MNKKAYQKPTMQIVELRQQTRLLTGSDPLTASRTSYGAANYGVSSQDINNEGEWEWN